MHRMSATDAFPDGDVLSGRLRQGIEELTRATARGAGTATAGAR